MKKLFIALLLTLLFIPASANAADNDRWIWIQSDDDTGWFFDGETIMADNYSKNIITVWVKVQYSPAYAREIVKKYNYDRAQYKDYSYSLQKVQLDIKTRKIAILSVISYTTGDKVIDQYNFPVEWDDIMPDSDGEYAFETIKAYYLENY